MARARSSARHLTSCCTWPSGRCWWCRAASLSSLVGLYEQIADLPLEIEGYELDGLEHDFAGQFLRMTTLIRLRGGGEEGVGEDVVYDGLDHVAFQDAGPSQPLAGSWTIDSFSKHLDGLELFPSPPERESSRDYRRWAFESAA